MDSQNLESTFVNKIPQITHDQHFIIKTEWQSNQISLQILDTYRSKECEGVISLEELRQSAEELEIPYGQFFDECKEALTSNEGSGNFQYTLEDNNFTLLKKDLFQIQYLEIPMKPNPQLNHSFAMTAVDLISSLRTDLSKCKQASGELNEKHETMVSTMKKCLEEKNQLEKSLLEKFAVLLNSKKDKIAELQDLLAEKTKMLEDAGKSAEIPTPTYDKPRKRKSTDKIDDSEDFMKATQVMTQPSETLTLPKRVKHGATDAVRHVGCMQILREAAELSLNEMSRRPPAPEMGQHFYDFIQ